LIKSCFSGESIEKGKDRVKKKKGAKARDKGQFPWEIKPFRPEIYRIKTITGKRKADSRFLLLFKQRD
jgi:hypothetical protein